MTVKWDPKDPASVETYTLDWTDALDGDTITGSTWVLDQPAFLTIQSQSFTGASTSVLLSGGRDQDIAVLVNTVTTAGGQTLDPATVILPIVATDSATIVPPPQTTVADLIALALLDAGIVGQGQTATAEDTNNAFRRLNYMISEWARKRWLVYRLVDATCFSTGALSYSIGPGGDFNVVRPDRIESAFARQILPSQANPIDYSLQIIQSREDYNLIAMKTLGTWPSCVFYDSGWPWGQLFVWPLPAASQFELHVSLKQPVNQFGNVADLISLPPEYEAAIFHNLVLRLRSAYQLPVDPVQVALAKDALNVLRGANTQIPTLRMPNAVVGNARAYNVYSDGY